MLTRLKALLPVGVLTIFITCIAFFAGYFARAETASADSERYPLLTQAEAYIDQDFVHNPPDPTQLQYGAIQGMLSALNDKFSFFVAPPVTQSESNVLSGQYGGIGVQIKRSDSGLFALYPIPGSPADKAGVMNGDLLLTINGVPVAPNIQPDALDQSLRGEVKAGNGVTIVVQRQTSAATPGSTPVPTVVTTLTFTIEFQVIEVPSVLWRVLNEDSSLGYIQILNFTSRTPDELQNALADFKSKGVKGLVLDLRNNPGGLLDTSVKTAGGFLDGGVVVVEQSRTQSTIYTAPSGQATDMPLVTLINGGTASAAELVSAALHDRGRTTLIGQPSYGKGSVQLILLLSDNSSIHLTTAEWLTPNCNSLNGKGLTPDVPITPDPNGRDLELAEGIKKLQQQIAQQKPSPTGSSPSGNCERPTPSPIPTGSKG